MKTRFALLAAILALSGCAISPALTQERQEVASAHIGCAAEEISVVNTGSTSWRATCRGKVFHCSVAPSASCTAQL